MSVDFEKMACSYIFNICDIDLSRLFYGVSKIVFLSTGPGEEQNNSLSP